MARWIVMAGLTALLVLGYLATQYPGDGLGRRNVSAIEAELQQKAEQALANIGANQWAIVTVDGQIARLAGEAPTEADRQDALDAVKKSEWSGGALVGGITKVINDTTLAAAKTPYEWAAILGAGGRVRLSGYVPGKRPRAAIIAEAKRLFPAGVDDQMVIACCNPAGDWSGTAIWSLAQLSRLTLGEARFTDKNVVIRGTAPNATVKAEVESSATKIAKGFKAASEITLNAALELTAPDPVDEVPETPVPEAPVQSVAAADCQRMVDKFMASNTIAFASNSANLRSVGTPILDRLAGIASQCGALRFRVTGHTDASQAELANRDLSKQRAETVAAYLASKGVGRDRISTFGVGASQPATEDPAPDAQAKNRRIEITVITN